ncbi:MAG TPA: 23S rRNA (pseudouridine(1915)-N(3))-methyltransferase RlmH [Candidatus Saccharibacteria bacterium]|jgi:23S rRNA (pseudouridine1915-N3)-methyltransferase|nr:23S rRNA (pseudouridine(1915)-N(3))-methyltransferase RlmH [Candidatus Saccharibacteria bacterium]HMR38757.1 23S rRNA (pseudouridine(1915)-N(3))-methyltransferase RlmH [Candidatus Saccharibacteria bacterium]
MIRIIAIGRKHESWIAEGLERYQKRLKQPWNIEWVLLPHSAREGLGARQEESQCISNRLNDTDFVVLLDETGKPYNSPALSELCQQVFNTGKKLVFVIGGAYGVDDAMRQRADRVLSLSKLVFPHQLVRLIVVEQLYRSQEIASGGKYHHE